MKDRLNYANVMATIAVFVALGGSAVAAKVLLPKNSVTSKSVKDGSLKGKDLANGTITGDKVANNTLSAANINHRHCPCRAHLERRRPPGSASKAPSRLHRD